MKTNIPYQTMTVKCPGCGREFPLGAAVLGSVRDGVRKELSAEVSRRQRDLEEKLAAAGAREEKLRERAAKLDDEVQARLAARVEQAETEARKKAEEAISAKMKDLEGELSERTKALREAEKKELDLRKEQRRLRDEREAFELDVARKLDAEREKMRRQISEQAAEQGRLKLAEKEQLIADLRREMEVLQRKAGQGSQQAQGEVLELDLAAALRANFPSDEVTEVAKGVRGADIAQAVVSQTGRRCGVILYEAKRTKEWGKEWAGKLKTDMISAKADAGVIVSEVLPEGVRRFGLVDGVWVADRASAVAVAHALRWSLTQVAVARLGAEGAREKTEILYAYLTGSEFRQRVEAVVEAFTSMKTDLETEKRAITRQWAKREKQLGRVVENMSAMFGDIQGLSGNALQAIAALELTG